MVESLTADIFAAFITGSLSVLGGGLIFEGGKQYVKIGGSNEFKGKAEALPFFFLTIILGYLLQIIQPQAESFAQSIPPLTRIGVIGFATMLLFNYSVPNFNYLDGKSLLIYLLFLAIGYYPFSGLQL